MERHVMERHFMERHAMQCHVRERYVMEHHVIESHVMERLVMKRMVLCNVRMTKREFVGARQFLVPGCHLSRRAAASRPAEILQSPITFGAQIMDAIKSFKMDESVTNRKTGIEDWWKNVTSGRSRPTKLGLISEDVD